MKPTIQSKKLGHWLDCLLVIVMECEIGNYGKLFKNMKPTIQSKNLQEELEWLVIIVVFIFLICIFNNFLLHSLNVTNVSGIISGINVTLSDHPRPARSEWAETYFNF